MARQPIASMIPLPVCSAGLGTFPTFHWTGVGSPVFDTRAGALLLYVRRSAPASPKVTDGLALPTGRGVRAIERKWRKTAAMHSDRRGSSWKQGAWVAHADYRIGFVLSSVGHPRQPKCGTGSVVANKYESIGRDLRKVTGAGRRDGATQSRVVSEFVRTFRANGNKGRITVMAPLMATWRKYQNGGRSRPGRHARVEKPLCFRLANTL